METTTVSGNLRRRIPRENDHFFHFVFTVWSRGKLLRQADPLGYIMGGSEEAPPPGRALICCSAGPCSQGHLPPISTSLSSLDQSKRLTWALCTGT